MKTLTQFKNSQALLYIYKNEVIVLKVHFLPRLITQKKNKCCLCIIIVIGVQFCAVKGNNKSLKQQCFSFQQKIIVWQL